MGLTERPQLPSPLVRQRTPEDVERIGASTEVASRTQETTPAPATSARPASIPPARRSRRTRLSWLRLGTIAFDAAVVALVVYGAAIGREALPQMRNPDAFFGDMAFVGPIITVVWLGAVALWGGYRGATLGEGPDEYKRVLHGSLFAAAAVCIVSFLARYDLSRMFFLILLVAGPAALLVGRYLLRRCTNALRRRGALQKRVLLVGNPSAIDEIAEVLTREKWLGYEIIGAVVPGASADLLQTPEGVPVVCRATPGAADISDSQADLVVFAGGGFVSSAQMRSLAWDLEEHRVQVVIAPSVTDVSRERLLLRPVAGLPLIHIDRPRALNALRRSKRMLDVVGSAALIVLFSPVLAFAAFQIKRCDGGSVFFRQTRVGLDGEEFSCWKFRTMVPDAEALVEKLQQQLGETALLFKVRTDARVTRPGRWLRRFSIDELPQLFNVFMGDMSLVGPRPQVPREVELYDDVLRRRLRVRPGMTGLWQISGRSDLSVKDSVRLDLFYVDNWSMLQDMMILWRTLGAVVGGRGAY